MSEKLSPSYTLAWCRGKTDARLRGVTNSSKETEGALFDQNRRGQAPQEDAAGPQKKWTRRGISKAFIAAPAALLGFKELGMGVNARTAEEKLQEGVSLDDFLKDADADYHNAFVCALRVLAARGGGVLSLPPGKVEVASASLGTAGLTLPSGVEVRGQGESSTTIKITGTSVCNLFVSNNQSGTAITNVKIYGNSALSASGIYNSGACYNFTLTSAATTDVTGPRVENVQVENFQAPWWLLVQNQNNAYRIRKPTFRNIYAVSYSGNAYGPNDISINSAVICINGDDGTATPADPVQKVIEKVVIENVIVEATHIKTGVILYHQVQIAELKNITVRNAGKGAAFTTDDRGAYAILLYDNTSQGYGWTLDGFDVSAKSAGIYVAGGQDIVLKNGRASDTTDVTDATLPKAGIAINGTVRFAVENVYLSNNDRSDVAIAGPSITKRVDGKLSEVRTDGASPVSVRIKPNTTQPIDGLTIQKSHLVGSTYGVAAFVSSTQLLNDFTIRDSYIEGGTYGFDSFVLSVGTFSDNWVFERATFSSPVRAVRARAVTGTFVIKDCEAVCSGTAKCFEMTGSTDLHITNLKVTTRNLTSR